MSSTPAMQPVDDSIAKINQEVAVGEDLEFQRRWWRFEKIAWAAFVLILVLDLAGVFGRGPLAHAERRTSDGAMDVKYDRIARSQTPSILNINFGPAAIHNGSIQIYVSESLVDELGTQRVIPAPTTTVIGEGGLTYTFPANGPPATLKMALQPSTPGLYRFVLEVPGSPPVHASIFVVP